MREPIIKCPPCKGEGIRNGSTTGLRVCGACKGVGLRAIEERPDKHCSCGVRYDALAWTQLPYVGRMDDETECLELRNCRACGSTMAVLMLAKDDTARVVGDVDPRWLHAIVTVIAIYPADARPNLETVATCESLEFGFATFAISRLCRLEDPYDQLAAE